jgi:hypothetical protein
MFSLARFQGDGDVKGSTGGDGAADSRHGDDGDVFDLDVGGGFGDEHEGFVEAEEEAFVGFDGAFDAVHVVVAVGEMGSFVSEGGFVWKDGSGLDVVRLTLRSLWTG